MLMKKVRQMDLATVVISVFIIWMFMECMRTKESYASSIEPLSKGALPDIEAKKKPAYLTKCIKTETEYYATEDGKQGLCYPGYVQSGTRESDKCGTGMAHVVCKLQAEADAQSTDATVATTAPPTKAAAPSADVSSMIFKKRPDRRISREERQAKMVAMCNSDIVKKMIQDKPKSAMARKCKKINA